MTFDSNSATISSTSKSSSQYVYRAPGASSSTPITTPAAVGAGKIQEVSPKPISSAGTSSSMQTDVSVSMYRDRRSASNRQGIVRMQNPSLSASGGDGAVKTTVYASSRSSEEGKVTTVTNPILNQHTPVSVYPGPGTLQQIMPAGRGGSVTVTVGAGRGHGRGAVYKTPQ